MNLAVSFYEGKYDISYECGDESKCRFRMCEVMPPDGSEACLWKEYGMCRFPGAQRDALRRMRDWIGKKIKEVESDDND